MLLSDLEYYINLYKKDINYIILEDNIFHSLFKNTFKIREVHEAKFFFAKEAKYINYYNIFYIYNYSIDPDPIFKITDSQIIISHRLFFNSPKKSIIDILTKNERMIKNILE